MKKQSLLKRVLITSGIVAIAFGCQSKDANKSCPSSNTKENPCHDDEEEDVCADEEALKSEDAAVSLDDDSLRFIEILDSQSGESAAVSFDEATATLQEQLIAEVGFQKAAEEIASLDAVSLEAVAPVEVLSEQSTEE